MMWRTGGVATPAEGCRRAGWLAPCKDEVNVLYMCGPQPVGDDGR